MSRTILILLAVSTLLHAGSRSVAGAVNAITVTATPANSDHDAYRHDAFRAEELGSGPRSYWLYEPVQQTPRKAPVVVLYHGWMATNPGVYGAWIQHLCRLGNVVIFPRYQADWKTPPADFLPNAVGAVRDALDVLRLGPGRVRPDLEKFALIGHSAGGNLAALMAASAEASGLPRPRAVLAFMPGEVRPAPGPSLADIPAETLMVVVVGDLDLVVGDARARHLHAGATAVPPERKLFLMYRTDRGGSSPLIADHLAPTAALPELDNGDGPMRTIQMARARTDVLDRHGFWRLTDLTLDAAFTGQTLAEATDDGSKLRDLGRWGNGRRVTPPLVSDDIALIPRLIPTRGIRLISWDPEATLTGALRSENR